MYFLLFVVWLYIVLGIVGGGGVLACVGWCMLVGVFVDWLVICVGWLLYLLIGC